MVQAPPSFEPLIYFFGSASCVRLPAAHSPPMQKCVVECGCGTVYTRLEVEAMHDEPHLHQFSCGVCGRTIEAGVTRSVIGYRLIVQPDGPFVEPKRSTH
jgi:hypothetical protein